MQDLWTADRKLWLTTDRKTAVEDGDARAAFLLCGSGQSIPRAQAEELGLIASPEPEAAAEPGAKEQEKSEDKELAPAEDKSKKGKQKDEKKSRKTARKEK